MAANEKQSTHFGYRDVPLDEKQSMVDGVFHSVARRYDLMNDLMSAGLHREWKEILVSKVRPPKSGREFRLLDVAGGTGDVSFRTLAVGGPGTNAIIADINVEMLKVGRERAAALPFADRVEFVEANAESLPFPDKHFDAVTIAFGIRNVPRIPVALAEMFRVLKHGGHFLCLEFSNTDMPVLDDLYEMYSFKVIPEVGRMVTGDRESYQYLVESIRKFPGREIFSGMIGKTGFARVKATALSGGIVALHTGWRL